MTPLAIFHLSSVAARGSAVQAVRDAPPEAVCLIQPPRRSLTQNDKLHAMLTDISRQVKHYDRRLNLEQWKDLCTAGWRGETNDLDPIPGLNGGVVLLGLHTSGLSRSQFTELIDWTYAYGNEHGVQWSDPEKRAA